MMEKLVNKKTDLWKLLKTGALVIFRNGKRAIVLRDCAIVTSDDIFLFREKDGDWTHIDFFEFDEDLTYLGDGDGYDIMKIYEFNYGFDFTIGRGYDRRELLWERKQYKTIKNKKDVKK